MRFLLLTILTYTIYLPLTGFSQEIRILSETNLMPVSDAMVFNQDQKEFFLSDNKGMVQLKNYTINDTIYFRHPSFKTKIIAYPKLLNNATIYLEASMVNLSEVVIAANKWAKHKEEVPNKITTIELESVELHNPQTSADLLASSGEVFIQKSQLGGGSPIIRGFSTNTVLLVIDGVRLNNAIYRSGNLQNVINLDPNSMASVEILFGPGSVIYGSDALGGVMHFTTLNADFAHSDASIIKSNALIRYSSANQEKTGHIDFSIARKRFTSVTSISFSSFDDLVMGSQGNNNEQYLSSNYVQRIDNKDSVIVNENPNKQVYSAYDQFNVMQKLNFKVDDKQSLDYGFHYSSTSDIPRYDALRQLSDGEPKYAEWYYGPQQWMMHNINYNNEIATKAYSEFKITAAYQNYKESRHSRKLNDEEKVKQFENVDIFSLNADFNKEFGKKSSVYYGAELIYNGLNSVAETENIVENSMSTNWTIPRYPDGENNYLSAASYIGSSYGLSDKTILTAGLRYSYIHLASTFENSYYEQFGFASNFTNNNSAINGNLGLNYSPGKNWQLKANLSSGFNAPNWDGLGKVFTPKKDVVIVPNPDLKPQYAYNAELAAIKYFGNKNVKLEAVVFYTYLDNPMVQLDFNVNGQDSLYYNGSNNAIHAMVNGEYANIYGFYSAIQANLTKNLGLKGNFTYTQGMDDMGNSLRHVAPVFGSFHFIYQTLKFNADLNIQYNGQKKAEDMAYSEIGKDYMYAMDENGNLYSPAWYTLNFKLNYQLSKNLQLSTGVENILDARYRPYSSGIVAPGMNFILALRAKI